MPEPGLVFRALLWCLSLSVLLRVMPLGEGPGRS